MWPNVKTGKVLLGSLLALATSHYSMEAQTDQKYLPADSTSDTVSAVAPSENKTKSSLFYYLVMSGKTQDQFRPLTQSERAESYAKRLFSPFLSDCGRLRGNNSMARRSSFVGARRGRIRPPVRELLRQTDGHTNLALGGRSGAARRQPLFSVR